MALMNKAFGSCLRASTLDDLKQLSNGSCKFLLLDDFDDVLKDLPRGSLISLFDLPRGSSLKARY